MSKKITPDQAIDVLKGAPTLSLPLLPLISQYRLRILERSPSDPMHSPPVYEIDLSKAWDTLSQVELFIRKLKRLKIYRPNLLFRGFDGQKMSMMFSGRSGKNIIFCSQEFDLFNENGFCENALKYAFQYDEPAIAIYDDDKDKLDRIGSNEYQLKDPSALIAIIRLK